MKSYNHTFLCLAQILSTRVAKLWWHGYEREYWPSWDV